MSEQAPAPDRVIDSADVPLIEQQDLASAWLQKDDRVVARKHVFDDDGVLHPPLITDFTISGINGSRVYGSPHFPEGLSQKDGWWFDLVNRPTPLPSVLSEIDAVMSNGETYTLMGKSQTWVRVSDGSPVNLTDIVSYTQT